MTEETYIILSFDESGITADDYSRKTINELLEWSEECNGIKMKSENGCTNFTDDVYAIDGDTCMLVRGEIVLPKEKEKEIVLKRTISEYKL